MHTPGIERRRRRSEKPEFALQYQLVHVCEKGRLEALVLADSDGLLLANVGDEDVCQELGAIAPLIGRSRRRMPLPPLLEGADVAVRPVAIHGRPLFLASVGGGVARDALLLHSMRGVQRILQSN